MAENEVLKEKVDVLFKLGRSYLNREIEGKEKIKDKNDQKIDDDEDIQEVGAETEVTDEDLSAWTKNKLRGFKRTAPTASSQPKAPTPKRTEKKTPTASPPPAGTSPVPPPPAGITSTPPPPEVSPGGTPANPRAERDHGQDDYYKGKYCHFFVNTGKCNYEERSGKKCKFEHRTAPMCNYGVSCSRPKCMFSHPNLNGTNSSFLGGSRGMPPMNPWQMGQMINPWMTTTPNQFLTNPWNMQGNQNQNQQ